MTKIIFDLIEYKNTVNLVDDVCYLIDGARQVAYQTVDAALVLRN